MINSEFVERNSSVLAGFNRILSGSRSQNRIILVLLISNLLVNILLTWSTTTFKVSDANSNLLMLEALRNGKDVYIFNGTSRGIIPHIANILGDFPSHPYRFLYLQCVLATLTLYVIYRYILLVTQSRKCGMVGLMLVTFYVDFHMLSPVFYYQVIEVLFVSIVLYLSAILILKSSRLSTLVSICLIPGIIWVSYLFRGTLYFYYLLLGMMSLWSYIHTNKQLALKFLITSCLCLLIFQLFSFDIFKSPLSSSNSSNTFIFFGHTWYGGNGGEGSFVYDRNEVLYNKNYQMFLEQNHIDHPSASSRFAFQKQEIHNSVFKHPVKWIYLQVRKVIYTYGMVPVRDGIVLLSAGKLRVPWLIAALITQISFATIFLLFLITMITAFSAQDLARPEVALMILVLLYLVAGTSLYGHYQERYRIVVVMCAIIPLISMYIMKARDIVIHKRVSRKRLIMVGIVVSCVMMVWSYQIANIYIYDYSRYNRVIESF